MAFGNKERSISHVQEKPLKEALKNLVPSLNNKRLGHIEDKDIYALNGIKQIMFPRIDY